MSSRRCTEVSGKKGSTCIQLEMVIYLLQSLLSQHGTQRFWFWVCVAFIALGLIGRVQIDAVMSILVAMNIASKDEMYEEGRWVFKPGDLRVTSPTKRAASSRMVHASRWRCRRLARVHATWPTRHRQ